MKCRKGNIYRVARPLFVALCVALFAGCSDGDELRRLDEAERIMGAEPERALEIVEGVDLANMRTEEGRARYALIYSEACYYNFVDVESDTLTRPMMRYYLQSDDHAERARAMYQHAVVSHYCGELAEAMVALMEAEESLQRVPNVKLMGLVQRLKGDIYSDGCLYANALEAYTLARGCFEEQGLGEHVLYMDYDLGGTLIQLRRFEDARIKLDEVLRSARLAEDRALMCGVIHELLALAI